ncbi:hypothetical protein DFA_10388 [Cavenderia fasciculata]|uniref:Transmembrane protein n=1 Tax=Cavenderia fasciculata TaxID=261658 RepID=F4QA27_CACFS|nr:uncharacterized protein DFA_10388 [Cavenderia fasciculata]EGG15546.1 hypothetical protein DFA_10388 [Cavenderia fasciculata]|eukprot:XP_004354288.1 hypothetical protein DFA_10388 [Cavenderia fasciculata]
MKKGKNSYMLLANQHAHEDDDDDNNDDDNNNDIDSTVNNNKDDQSSKSIPSTDDDDDYDENGHNNSGNNNEQRNLLNNNSRNNNNNSLIMDEEEDEETERNVILFSNRDPSVSIFATPSNNPSIQSMGGGTQGGESSTNNQYNNHFPFPRTPSSSNNYYPSDDDDDENDGHHTTIDMNQLHRHFINSPPMNGGGGRHTTTTTSTSTSRQLQPQPALQLKQGEAIIISEPGGYGNNIVVGFNDKRFNELGHDGSHNLASYFKNMADPSSVSSQTTTLNAAFRQAAGDDGAAALDEASRYLSEHRYGKAKKLLSSITLGEILACAMISLEVPIGLIFFLLVFIVAADVAVFYTLAKNKLTFMSYIIFGSATVVFMAGFFIPIPSVISLIRLIVFMVSLNARREINSKQ